MKTTVLAAALGLAATATATSAHDWGWGSGIDRRQSWQQHRIERGVRSGEITDREYWRLQREQAYIRHLERNAKADGYLSHYERARIRAAQNAASRHIHNESHDRNQRWYRRFW